MVTIDGAGGDGVGAAGEVDVGIREVGDAITPIGHDGAAKGAVGRESMGQRVAVDAPGCGRAGGFIVATAGIVPPFMRGDSGGGVSLHGAIDAIDGGDAEAGADHVQSADVRPVGIADRRHLIHVSVIAVGHSVEAGGDRFARRLHIVGEVGFDEAGAGVDSAAGEGGVETVDGILRAGDDGVRTAELGKSGGGIDDHDVKLGITRCRGAGGDGAVRSERRCRTESGVFSLRSGGFLGRGVQAVRAAHDARVHRKKPEGVVCEAFQGELAVLRGGDVQVKGVAKDREGDLGMGFALDSADPRVVGCASAGSDGKVDGQCVAVRQREQKTELTGGFELAECAAGEPEGRGLGGSRRRAIEDLDQRRGHGNGRRLRRGRRSCRVERCGRRLETQQKSNDEGGEEGNVGGFQGWKL